MTSGLSPARRLGFLGLVVLVASGTLAGRSPRPGEVGATEAANRLPELVVDALAVVMQLGARPAIVLVAVVAAALADRGRVRVAAAVVLAGGLAWTGAAVAKEVVDRPRPAGLGADVVVRDDAEADGFPSAHVSIATATLVAAGVATGRRPAPGLVIGGVVGLGRMAAGVHLPLDVVGGLGLGALVAVASVELVDR